MTSYDLVTVVVSEGQVARRLGSVDDSPGWKLYSLVVVVYAAFYIFKWLRVVIHNLKWKTHAAVSFL